ncbi:MAG: HlyD family efflux transporter periplasmic adaptor subunit [Vicinamibacteria bacterium]|jgi:HlyD family secretion protein|nr:HlyD family efflux transporter periplasmic adaptor subunit [Vicinamibacteria bacterium]
MRHPRAVEWTLAILATCAMGCSGVRAESESTAEARVERRTVEDVFLLTGELAAVRAVELAVPRLPGMDGGMQIKWIAQDGAEVAKDDVVVELDNGRVSGALEERRTRELQGAIALEQREATLEAERSVKAFEVESAAVALAKAKVEAEVPVELRARKEWHEKQQAMVKAEAAHDKARVALEAHDRTTAADLKVLRIALEKARREVAQSEESLRGLQLRAPRAGVVLLGRSPQEDRPMQLGDNLWPGLRAASLPDLSELEVAAYLPEVDDGRVLPGQTARVILDSALDRVHDGRVEVVAAVAQDARYAGGFKVRVSLAKTDAASMRPGLSARVEVVRSTFKDALVTPRASVSWVDAQARVARPGGGFTNVVLSACLALECVVESGLREGDRVAIR